MTYPHVHIENRRLQGVLNALRALGNTTLPMGVAIRMVKTQKTIITHLETVQEVNNSLIKQYGETDTDTGAEHVTPEMDGWGDFQKEAALLNMVEFNVGQPFVVYEREQEGEVVYGWTDPVKTPIDVGPNVLVDMGDLLVIDLLVPEEQVVGSITPAEPAE